MNREERIKAMAEIMIDVRKADEDVGLVISASLAAAAKELGGIEALVEGRPGSWEAEIVRRMASSGQIPGIGLATRYDTYIQRLAPLFVEMGQTKEDGGDILSQAMGQAVDALGGLKQFAGDNEDDGSVWYHDLMNIGRQYSAHWDESW